MVGKPFKKMHTVNMNKKIISILILIIIFIPSAESEVNLIVAPSWSKIHEGYYFQAIVWIQPINETLISLNGTLIFNQTEYYVDNVTNGNLFNTFYSITGCCNNITIYGRGNANTTGVFFRANVYPIKPLSYNIISFENITAKNIEGNNIQVSAQYILVEFYPRWDNDFSDEIDILDMVLVAQHLGESNTTKSWDIDMNHVVDFTDLNIVASKFGLQRS